MAPKHPKHDIKQTNRPVIRRTIAAPKYKFVPNNSLKKDLSTTTHKPRLATIIPPN